LAAAGGDVSPAVSPNHWQSMKEVVMDTRRQIFLSALVASGVLVTASAMGAGNYSAMSGKLPPEQTQGDVTYLMGGVGKEEAAALRRNEANFPVTLEFLKHAKPHAEYVSNVNVTIKDHEGKTMLNTVADGPLLLAKLPDGKYTVTASDDGISKERNIVVAARKPERIVFEW
jgi:hypothetical protein